MAFQSPKGTRDFYPAEMALRRYIEDTWRRVSLRHGFVEVDGPTFEFLDLYKVKSGDEIVSQLFCVDGKPDKQGQIDHYALRPEFTPTLARMVAAKANALPRPIKWFSVPRCYRGETPQKGRLREFIQWNVDMLGGETPEARRRFDLEVAALCVDCLRELGLTASDVTLRWNDRQIMDGMLQLAGVTAARKDFAYYLLDRLEKLQPVQRAELYEKNGVTDSERAFFEKIAQGANPATKDFWRELGSTGAHEVWAQEVAAQSNKIEQTLASMGLSGFAQFDAGIVRGLAYYTGFVFEVSDARGVNRAIAGGGRYDKLIEMFGGPSLPAVGFGMGDVVLCNLLEELGKLPVALKNVGARAEVFVIDALDDDSVATSLMGRLRASEWDDNAKRIARPGIAVASSYKTTKSIGKLMPEASASGARLAVILAPAEFARGMVKLKDLQTREEEEVPLAHVVDAIRAFFHPIDSQATGHLLHTIQRARKHSSEWSVSAGTEPLNFGPSAGGPQMRPGKVHLPITTPNRVSGTQIHAPGGLESASGETRTLNSEEAKFIHLLRKSLGKE